MKKEYLVIIDMQKDFIDGSLANPAAEAIVPDVCEAIRAFVGLRPECDETPLKIILTRDTHGYNYLKTNEGKHLPVPHCINGTEGWLVDKRIRDTLDSVSSYGPIEYLDKNTFGTIDWYSVIRSDTPLADGSDVDITVCGTCTSICVASNAAILKALFPEANISVLKDCCADINSESHEAALLVMKNQQINLI